MIASVLIISFSLVLFVYWFRYSCLLLLRRGSEQPLAAPGRFNYAAVQQSLQAGKELDPLHRSLDRDYRVLTYLLEHAAALELAQLEYRLLTIDYSMMQAWYRLTNSAAPAAGAAGAGRDGGRAERAGRPYRQNRPACATKCKSRAFRFLPRFPPHQPASTALQYKTWESEATLKLAVDRLNAVRREIAKVIVGQDDVVEGVLICLLAGGHVLLEGVPGLGKRPCYVRWRALSN